MDMLIPPMCARSRVSASRSCRCRFASSNSFTALALMCSTARCAENCSSSFWTWNDVSWPNRSASANSSSIASCLADKPSFAACSPCHFARYRSSFRRRRRSSSSSMTSCSSCWFSARNCAASTLDRSLKSPRSIVASSGMPAFCRKNRVSSVKSSTLRPKPLLTSTASCTCASALRICNRKPFKSRMASDNP